MTTDYRRSALILIALAGLFSTLYNAFLPLHGDEAYYWLWSHHLQAGYYDHPPMIALLIALSNVVSEAEWGVRLVNVAAMSAAAWVIFIILEDLRDARTGFWGVVIFNSVVLVHAGYTIVTTDAPLVLFWSLGLLSAYRVLTRARTADFILTGLFVGAMMLSKYTSVLFIIALLLFLLLRRRDLFSDRRLWMAVLIALTLILSLLWWNYRHDWISFLFQLNHGGAKPHIMWNWFGEFLGAQFGVFSPVFAAVLFFTLFKERLYYRDDVRFFFTLLAAFPLLFFLYKSLHTHIELNFAAPAYLAGTILVADYLSRQAMIRTLYIGIAVALFFSLAARVGLLFWLPVVQDRMYGNKEAIALLNQYRKADDALYANHLTIAALLTYYTPGHPEVRIPTPSRFSQYDLWDDGSPFGDGLYLAYRQKEKLLRECFAHVTLLDTLTVQRGLERTKTFYLYRVGEAKKR